MRKLPLLTVLALSAACNQRPPEYGVMVFSNDTSQVVFSMHITGTLFMGLRADRYQMQPDSSLHMTTPAELIVQRGTGDAKISSVNGAKVVLQPFGVRLDSLTTVADTAAVVGQIVKIERRDERRKIFLSVEKP